MDLGSNLHFSAGQLDLLDGFEESGEKLGDSSKNMQSENSWSDSISSNGDSCEALVPETLLIVDTETTGLDIDKDNCLEVGAILFHVSARSVLAQQSFLLPVDSNEAELINRIPADITRISQPIQLGLNYLQGLIDSSDLLVAHNASFDKQWFGKAPLPNISKKWLCTMEDISWPEKLQLRKRPSVRDLALAYGIPVWSAHRALTDCIYLAEVFSRCEDLETLLLHGLEPRQLMRAKVSYDDRNLARKAGFCWNDPVKGAWTRRVSARELENLNFPVVPIETRDIY